jgi:radical SAM superfamily enzyme YgiQ (UPF0313 family)
LARDTPHILFVNPWIHDFAAYDVWGTPLGLLKLAAICRQAGIRVSYLNCLDRFYPQARNACAGGDGRGAYHKVPIPKPQGLEDVPRRFSRYGIPVSWFDDQIRRLPPPDMIMVTSMMTYWYSGVQFTIRRLRDHYAGIPIILGGTYASLCKDHALRTSGADSVVSGPGESHLNRLLQTFLNDARLENFDPNHIDAHPTAAIDLASRIPHAPVLTSTGCPFHCAYCASHHIAPDFKRRCPQTVVSEIETWHRQLSVSNFAFYDDALLYRTETHFEPMLKLLMAKDMNIRFHTPNALHLRWLTPTLARLMHGVGFKSIRLGLETTVFGEHRPHDQKVTFEEFEQAAAYLTEAGFERRQVGAYLLVGLPEQPMDSILAAIEHVCRCGLTPIPAYYTPIPGTGLWDAAVAASRYDLTADPIFTNNALLPCRRESFSWDYQRTLKNHIQIHTGH